MTELALPFRSISGKLRRTAKSCCDREAGTCRPLSSTTFDTFKALFSSNEADDVSSSGMKVTFTVAVNVCVRGLISASMA